MGGCESGFTLPDLTDPNIVWATCYGNEVTRWDAKTRTARSVSPWLHTLDSPPTDAKYRCHWTPPLAIDPFDHNTVYYGCQVIFKTTNAGQSWSVISPDLSTQDPKYIVSSGGIVGDNLGQFYGEVVFAIAPSHIQKGLIWAGTNDGKIWYTKDGGGHWNDVTKNIGNVPPLGVVTSIQPSFFDPGTAYVSVDLHLMDNRDPFIYRTTDFGATWTQIGTGIPERAAFLRSLRRRGSEQKRFAVRWHRQLAFSHHRTMVRTGTRCRNGLPHAQTTWVVVQKQFHDLVVSTYGRGFYILDDITPLEQMAGQPASQADTELFASRAAYRFIHNGRAFVDYSLKSGHQGSGANPDHGLDRRRGARAARTGTSWTESRGMGSKVFWAAHNPASHDPSRKSSYPERSRDSTAADARPITHWGMSPNQEGPIVAPGKYTVKLTVDGQTYTQPLEVLKDPKQGGTDAEIEASVKMQLRIRDDVNKTSDMVNQIEWMRKQLADLEGMLRGEKGKDELLKSVQDEDQKMQDVEYKLLSKALTTSDDKYYIAAYKIYFNLLWLNGEVGPGAGDVAGGDNYGPTDTAREILDMIEKDLGTATAEYRNLMDKEVPAFNRSLGGHGITPLANVVPALAAEASQVSR